MKNIVVAIIMLTTLNNNYTLNYELNKKTFKNCTELNKVYPGGVALPGAVNLGGKTKKTPKFDKKLYVANKKSDRDKDGIACEK